MPADGKTKNIRRKRILDEADEEEEEAPTKIKETLEAVRLLQRQRERVRGLTADANAIAVGEAESSARASTRAGKGDGQGAPGEGEGGEELVLQDTFAQETAVIQEDPNMLKYIEQELAKKRGKDVTSGEGGEGKGGKSADEELYAIPQHLKVKGLADEEGYSSWTTGIAEVQLPIEFKLQNIEATEEAKRQLQHRRGPSGQRPPPTTLPASFSADFRQRGRDYADKMRGKEPGEQQQFSRFAPEFHPGAGGPSHGGGRGGERRQTATDEIMLQRFKNRERSRFMRR